MQREDVERLCASLAEHFPLHNMEGPCKALRALLDRAERAEAERDEAFAAGLQSAVAICKRVRSEEAENDDQAVGALECAIAIMDEVNALAAKPRP